MTPEKEAPPLGNLVRPKATLRAFLAEPLVRHLHRALDGAFAPLLARHGLRDYDRLRPYDHISLKSYIGLFEESALLTGRPCLGLELGQAFRLESIGPVYPLMASASTLRRALATFGRFQSAWQTHTALLAERMSDETCFTYMIEDIRIWPRRQDAEFTIAALIAIIRQLTSDRWAPVEVRFEHDVTEDEKALRRFCGCPVVGNAAANRVLVSDRDLDRPLQQRSEGSQLREIETHLEDLFRPNDDLSGTVRERVVALIGRHMGYSSLDIETIAAEMGMTSRTLRRHLAAERSGYSAILSEVRWERAESLLTRTSLGNEEIARRLGLSGAAVFSRAFRTWSGTSPASRRSRRKVEKG